MKSEQEIQTKIGEIYQYKDIIDLNNEQKPSILMLDMLQWVLSNEN